MLLRVASSHGHKGLPRVMVLWDFQGHMIFQANGDKEFSGASVFKNCQVPGQWCQGIAWSNCSQKITGCNGVKDFLGHGDKDMIRAMIARNFLV